MKNSTTIILVRHGQTEWNQQNRLQGHKNSPLTDIGKQQALATKEALCDLTFNSAYVSPLLRAKETLELILEQSSIKRIVDEGVKEISLGPWEGKTKEETRLSHPHEYDDFWQPTKF